nr:MAG TPA: hypothetical protein [Caudoviricetes sp.]
MAIQPNFPNKSNKKYFFLWFLQTCKFHRILQQNNIKKKGIKQ